MKPINFNLLFGLFFGILAVGCILLNAGSLWAVVLGIVGLVFAHNAKKAGYTGGMRTAGFVLSLIGSILGVVITIIGIASIGLLLGVMEEASSHLYD